MSYPTWTIRDVLILPLALAAVLIILVVAAILSPRGADLFERTALAARALVLSFAVEAGFFRLGETPTYFEGDGGGGDGGGDGGDGGDGSGDGGDGGSGDGNTLLADAQAAIKALSDAGTAIPEALTKAVSELAQARKDAANYRTKASGSSAEVKALQDQMKAIAKKLGIEDASDPAAIAEAAQAERDALAAENRTLKIGQALIKAAKTKGADADALNDSRTFMAEVEKLDLSKDDFESSLEELVEKTVKDNPKLKAQAARSGNDLSGGGGGGERPRSLEDAVTARLAG